MATRTIKTMYCLDVATVRGLRVVGRFDQLLCPGTPLLGCLGRIARPEHAIIARPCEKFELAHDLDGRVEHIARATLGHDQRGVRRVRFDLAAQSQDLHVDRPVVDLVVVQT